MMLRWLYLLPSLDPAGTSRDCDTIPKLRDLLFKLITGATTGTISLLSIPECRPACGLINPEFVSLFLAFSLSLKSSRLLSWFLSLMRYSICRISCSNSVIDCSSALSFYSVSNALSSFSKIIR